MSVADGSTARASGQAAPEIGLHPYKGVRLPPARHHLLAGGGTSWRSARSLAPQCLRSQDAPQKPLQFVDPAPEGIGTATLSGKCSLRQLCLLF